MLYLLSKDFEQAILNKFKELKENRRMMSNKIENINKKVEIIMNQIGILELKSIKTEIKTSLEVLISWFGQAKEKRIRLSSLRNRKIKNEKNEEK